MGHKEISPEREVHSNRSLTKKDRNISNKQPNPTLQELKEEKQTQPKVEGRKYSRSQQN